MEGLYLHALVSGFSLGVLTFCVFKVRHMVHSDYAHRDIFLRHKRFFDRLQLQGGK